MDRVIGTVVGHRPRRESGFRLSAELLEENLLIHNYGHGGAGISLAWGTAALAADFAVAGDARRAAVIGCGIAGLTAARELQERGFEVCIYAQSLPPDTTSNRSVASFTPTFGLASPERLTPDWVQQFRRAARISWARHQRMVGPRYGVSFINEYRLVDLPPAPSASDPWDPLAQLLPSDVAQTPVLLGPGEHPFGSPYAVERRTLRFEPATYLDALRDDVLAAGGRIEVRSFDSAGALLTLGEPVIVNCTGLGARALCGDEELVPVKGQLTLLQPQPEVDYMVNGMMPRSDAIVLNGGLQGNDDWSTDVDLAHQQAVLERFAAIFDAMRQPIPAEGG